MRASCSVEGCERPTKARGWCDRHYARWIRHGNVETVKPRRERVPPEERTCQQCGGHFLFTKAGKAYKGLYCSRACANRASKAGRFRRGEEHPNWRGGHISSQGYRMIWIDRKLVPEHRYVMAQSLGRALTSKETVHHCDGDRLNNDPSNLELWESRHPRGQRVEELPTEQHCPTCTCFA